MSTKTNSHIHQYVPGLYLYYKIKIVIFVLTLLFTCHRASWFFSLKYEHNYRHMDTYLIYGFLILIFAPGMSNIFRRFVYIRLCQLWLQTHGLKHFERSGYIWVLFHWKYCEYSRHILFIHNSTYRNHKSQRFEKNFNFGFCKRNSILHPICFQSSYFAKMKTICKVK